MPVKRTSIHLFTLVLLLVLLVGGSHAALQEAKEAPGSAPSLLAFSYEDTFGTLEEAYPPDAAHILTPGGITVDSAGNVYVVSERDMRVLAYNNGGANLFWLGKPGYDATGEYSYSDPRDVAVDGAGHLWVADGNRVVAYDLATRDFLRQLPAEDAWQAGDDNTHFDRAMGIAFDNSGRMFVTDHNNHRVQVYTFSSGEPVHDVTLGETGVPGSDNDHFNYPARLAVDSSNRLYVVDGNNGRVQRCAEIMGLWSCTTFIDGLTQPGGIALDNADQVYLSDPSNSQILQCDGGGTCTPFVTGLPGWTVDVALDSTGHLFATDWDHDVVREYDSSGNELSIFAGTEDVPYLADDNHFHEPWGMTTDDAGNVYVVERNGLRLLKLAPDGARLWSVGEPGTWGSDNQHFGAYWAGNEGSPAVDDAGNVYVTDTGNNRVQVFDANGNYLTTRGENGTGDGQFSCPAGIAVNPTNDDFIVNDRCNHRVQVFDSAWQHKVTLGTTGQQGDDNTHFSWPWDVATDSQGHIYIADADNFRVQRCTVSSASYQCTTFTGDPNAYPGSFDWVRPIAIDVDEAGRVYVSDEWNYRVQVFDAGGNYLTTIGGEWGSLPGEFRSPSGVTVAPDGTVYVSSQTNHTIQKFTRGVDGWQQVNTPGFGDSDNQGVWSVYPYNGALYASTFNLWSGAEVYRLHEDTWEQVVSGGFGNSLNAGVDDFIAFEGMLYAGIWNDDSDGGGQIWRSASGDSGSWQRVVHGGFGDTVNAEVMSLQTFGDHLYAGTWTRDGHGSEIWRSDSGDSGSWTRVADDGTFGESDNQAILAMYVFDGYLYAATRNTSSGGEIWRTNDGMTWTQVNDDGFGESDNVQVKTLVQYDSALYAGTRNLSGGQIWRTESGTTWTQVENSGFDGSDNEGIASLHSLGGYLYAVTANLETGPEVWRSENPAGGDWERVGNVGFGAGASQAVNWEASATVHDGTLYAGTFTFDSRGGGRLFRTIEQYANYLPLIIRQP